MILSERGIREELDPIDTVEHLAEHNEWDFDRVADDKIAMAIEGQWRSYSVTLASSPFDNMLRLICAFDMEPPEERVPHLYHCLNAANDRTWSGAFTYWTEHKLMAYRYGLLMSDDGTVTVQQVDRLVSAAVANSERFYPAFQLVTWGNRDVEEAMRVAITEAYGRA